MPLMIKLNPNPLSLGDRWMSREDWEDVFSGKLEELLELFDEDIFALLKDIGGLEMLIANAWWEDDPDED